ncbi:urea transporter [Streptosporangium carneum]|uniref:urea transporter n=1 Tax=Streptosporangium carneum TaxID=47481 RepID=UPI0022F2BA4A|nr:urea transporter [Streptosporangium carneum]
MRQLKPLALLVAVIRGIGQVDFMAGPRTGLVFLGALFVGGRRHGLYGLPGSAAVTLTAAPTTFFAPFGGHPPTWPFVLVTWAFLAAVPAFAPLRRAG